MLIRFLTKKIILNWDLKQAYYKFVNDIFRRSFVNRLNNMHYFESWYILLITNIKNTIAHKTNFQKCWAIKEALTFNN